MGPPSALVAAVFSNPSSIQSLSADQLDQLIRQSQRSGLLASLGRLLASSGRLELLSQAVQDRFEAADLVAREHERRARWEIHQVHLALRGTDAPIVLLKGSAYLLGGFPNAAGRLLADLDLLAPESRLAEVESALLKNGWVQTKQDAYDQRYYREWMHELPPMSHPLRGVEVDLHHNIAPRTSRLKVDADELLKSAVPVDDTGRFLRLSDQDLVLHLCVHLFHDGDLHNGLRQLIDLDGLLRIFGERETYWSEVTRRAEQLGLARPLSYGLHFAGELLATPVPQSTRAWADRVGPPLLLRAFIHACMRAAILPVVGDKPSRWRRFTEGLLYLRSHWLRMPLGLLVRHLWHQSRRRGGFRTAESARGNG